MSAITAVNALGRDPMWSSLSILIGRSDLSCRSLGRTPFSFESEYWETRFAEVRSRHLQVRDSGRPFAATTR